MPQIAKEPSKQFKRTVSFSRGNFLASSIDDLQTEPELDPPTRRG